MTPSSSPSIATTLTNESALLADLERLRQRAIATEKRNEAQLVNLADDQRASAANLLHYLTLRQQDVRSLQKRLAEAGLSSLGRSEAHVMATIGAVASTLSRLLGQSPERPPSSLNFEEGNASLRRRTEALFGPTPTERSVRIMVTMPTEAATDPTLVSHLVEKGMNVMRINCAHDDATVWAKMIERLHDGT